MLPWSLKNRKKNERARMRRPSSSPEGRSWSTGVLCRKGMGDEVHFPLYLLPEASTARKRRRQPAKTAAFASPMAFSPRVPQTTLALLSHNQQWHDRRPRANTTKASALFFVRAFMLSQLPTLAYKSFLCMLDHSYMCSLPGPRDSVITHRDAGDKEISNRTKKRRLLMVKATSKFS